MASHCRSVSGPLHELIHPPSGHFRRWTWRSLKHQWLFLHSLDSVTTIRRLVAFYVDEHNRVLPHSAFRGQTPHEMYVGTGDALPANLTSRVAAARRSRVTSTGRHRARPCPSNEAAT